MIPEDFYTISNTFMQFLYTLIWFWTLSYNPKLNLNPHSCNTLFNQKRWLKNGITGESNLPSGTLLSLSSYVDIEYSSAESLINKCKPFGTKSKQTINSLALSKKYTMTEEFKEELRG